MTVYKKVWLLGWSEIGKMHSIVNNLKLKTGSAHGVSWGQHWPEKPSSITEQLCWLKADIFMARTQYIFFFLFLWANDRNKSKNEIVEEKNITSINVQYEKWGRAIRCWVIWNSCRLLHHGKGWKLQQFFLQDSAHDADRQKKETIAQY